MFLHVMRPSGRESYPEGAERYAPHYLEAWLKHFPEAKPKARDKEDWVENACFLYEIERLGLPFAVHESKDSGWVSASADTLAQGDGEAAFFHTGIGGADRIRNAGNYHYVMQGPKALDAIAKHAASETFQRYAGRPMLLAKPDPKDIDQAVRQIVPGEGFIFLKTIKKEMARIFWIEADRSPWKCIIEQDEDMVWTIVQYEGTESPYFSIQGCIQPTYEYRMFIVGDQPVTGAGCVEAFTPLNNRDIFDVTMEPLRNQSEVEDQPAITEAYLQFAKDFAREFASETGLPLSYSLDLTIDANTGKIVPVELNPPMNLGRYASNIEAWIMAIDAEGRRLVGEGQ